MANEELKKQQAQEEEKAPETEAKAEKPEEKTEGPEAEAEEAEKPEKAEKNEKDPEEEALNTKYLRLMADFQNYKRRTEKEKSDIYAFANEKIVSELLNVIDNFERALDAGNEGDSFVEGMSLIFKQLQGVLEKAGVVEIEALGQDFDPNFHNAVMQMESEEYESGYVVQEMLKGYMYRDTVVRHSMVAVVP